MDERARIGIVGLGGIGKVHLAAYRDHPFLEVVAVADVDEQTFAGVGLSGVRGYTDHRRMLESEHLNIVLVATPAATHAGVVIDCAEAGVSVLCEKPLAVTVSDAERMVVACERVGTLLGYGASYRHLSAVLLARDLIRTEKLGDILCIREEAIGGGGPAKRQGMGPVHYPTGGPGDSTMGLADHGIHLLDLFPWLIGKPLVSVYGRGNISGGRQTTELVQMEFGGGTIGLLLYNDGAFYNDLPSEGIFSWGASWEIAGYVPPNRWSAHPGFIDIYGTKGSLKVFHYANQAFLTTESGVQQLPVLGPPAPAHFLRQMELFAGAVTRHEPPPVDGREGVAALRALHAVYESDRSGRRVALAMP